MQALLRFFQSLDARAWRTALVTFLLFGGVGLLFILVGALFGLRGEAAVESWLGLAARSPFALLIAVAAFAVLAFLGAPQIVLIAGAVVAFGPVTGSLYSWLGTLVSALIGFGLGRALGARALRRFTGPGVQRVITAIGHKGFLASLIIRLVPSAPFAVINMAAGVTPMRTWSFALGTGIGIVPKIVLTAVAGGSVAHARSGKIWTSAGLFLLAVVIWIISGLVARRWMRRAEGLDEEATDGGAT